MNVINKPYRKKDAMQLVTGSNMRGSAEYRRHLTGVLVRRAAEELENRAVQEGN